MEYVKVGGKEYKATISGRMSDPQWGNRQTKKIHFMKGEMDFDTVRELFVDGVAWSIISEWEEQQPKIDPDTGEVVVDPETGEPVYIIIPHRDEYDNSDFNLAGYIVDNRDGTVEVNMGKLTELEEAYEIILGGLL